MVALTTLPVEWRTLVTLLSGVTGAGRGLTLLLLLFSGLVSRVASGTRGPALTARRVLSGVSAGASESRDVEGLA